MNNEDKIRILKRRFNASKNKMSKKQIIQFTDALIEFSISNDRALNTAFDMLYDMKEGK